MKLTDQHLKDHRINDIIERFERRNDSWGTVLLPQSMSDDVITALLELKQRRAEDRQREDNRLT